MSLSSQFGTDKELERKGVWIEFPLNDDKTMPEFLLTRMSRSNPEYQKVADRHWAPHRKANRLGALPPEKEEAINLAIFCEAILIGWKEVPTFDMTGDRADAKRDSKGLLPKVAYSPENAAALLKRLPELYQSLQLLASDRANFALGELEGDAGNSSPSSNTPSYMGAES